MDIKKNQIPKFPSVVRCVFVDDKDYIWVVVGECFLDSDNQIRTESVIDIFDHEGVFLQTFESDVFSGVSIKKNGRLYSGSNAAGDDTIKVFKISYH